MKHLTLVKQATFGGLTLDYYGDLHGEFYMTRDQIGRALGYSNPQNAISAIHNRHKERLNPLSVIDNLSTTDGKHYETVLYSSRGIYEICRHSNRPNANAFYDFVYDILDGLRTGHLRLEVEKAGDVWKDTRQLGKVIRREETDSIRLLVEYATQQGSTHATRYYASLSRLADKAAGISDRDTATASQLHSLQLIERLIGQVIRDSIAQQLPYKAIYDLCRTRVESACSILILTEEVPTQ